MTESSLLNNWHDAYKLIAELLLNTYQQYPENPAKELYNRLKKTRFSEINQGRLFRSQLSRISEWGLDPIQIFATFNYPKIGYKRIDIINSLLEEFKSDKRVDNNTSFEGCPSPIITQIIQYRGWDSQNQIWKTFEEISEKGIKGLKQKHFLLMKKWRGIDIASFTMFLYWINSNEFLPMDRNTIDFLKSFNIIDSRPRTYKEYFELCTKKLFFSTDKYYNDDRFRNIVKDAYLYSNKEYTGEILSGSTISIISHIEPDSVIENLEIIAKQKQKERIKGFQIIALRPNKKIQGESSKQKHLKNLTEGELYQFYHSYKFNKNSDDKITYNSDEDLNLYSIGDLNISISAIVGKNGSGKSTIAEFLYLVINKIAFLKKVKTSEKLIDEEISADLFIRLDKLYKISVTDSIEVFEYELKDDNIYHLKTKKEEAKSTFDTFDIESFCYSIVVNYSLYALNTNSIGNWIYPLFHKNDSYQTPIVLNPLRKNGNIDVNNEEGLTKSRMLSNILEPDLINFETNSIPELVINSIPVKLILEFDIDKINRKKEKYRQLYKRLHQKHIDKVIYNIGFEINSDLPFLNHAKEYFFLKIVEIANKYPKFKKFKDLPHWISSDQKKFKLYLIKLSEETSHITFKLRQTINYLKYGIYTPDKENEILILSRKIREIKEEASLLTIELVPPAFFKTNIVFDHGGTFNELSSGEKQQVFSINTIAYHLYNISSVMYENDTLKYNNINIVFDEIELYFHPEMQRTYIKNLLSRISTLQLENDIHNINILFITHSPFILSDIPSSNILRLNLDMEFKKSIPISNTEQTFGANIHDLLANDFFLENGFMGEFSKNKINEIIQFLNIYKIISKLKQLDYKPIKLEPAATHLEDQSKKLQSEINVFIPKLSSDEFNIENKNSTSQTIEKLEQHISQNFQINISNCIATIKIIGEPVLKHKLMAMYSETFPISYEKSKEEEFLELAKELNYKVIKE
jgi:energy-coupling factor transporter ATP-binding protein EcfA2